MRPFLLIPFRLGPATARQREFIKTHGSIRTLIENLFGILASKFDLINNFQPTSVLMVQRVIYSIAILWNFLQLREDNRRNVFDYDRTHSGDRRTYEDIIMRPDILGLDGDEKREIISDWLEAEGI